MIAKAGTLNYLLGSNSLKDWSYFMNMRTTTLYNVLKPMPRKALEKIMNDFTNKLPFYSKEEYFRNILSIIWLINDVYCKNRRDRQLIQMGNINLFNYMINTQNYIHDSEFSQHCSGMIFNPGFMLVLKNSSIEKQS